MERIMARSTPLLLAVAVLSMGCGISCGRSAKPGPETTPFSKSTTASEDSSLVAVQKRADGRFDHALRYRGKPLVLNGSGLCEWGIFGLDLYQAALYVERPLESMSEALAADQIMVIHLDFVLGLSAKQLSDAFTASVKENSGTDRERLEPGLKQLLASMRDVRAGESYSFISDPKRGLIVQRGGATSAIIEDEAFRKLFVKLYLGDKPPTVALRRGLMGVQP